MYRALVLVVLGHLLTLSATAGPSAPPAYLDPVAEKAAFDALIHPIPQDTVEAYIAVAPAPHRFSDRAGQNDALKAKALRTNGTKVLEIGEHFPVTLAPETMFPEPFNDGQRWVFLDSIQSTDAYGVRLQLDLSGLLTGQTLYIIDPTMPRAFGPYTAADALPDGRWMPTVLGDTAQILVYSDTNTKPVVGVLSLSHIFEDLNNLPKILSCNVDIECETNPDIYDAANAVGVLLIDLGLSTGLCTGSLINNPLTEALEPFMITANHCIANESEAVGTEMRYDYRAVSCGSGDTTNFSSLPRSDVTELIATNANFDTTLLRLDSVPSGQFGRSFLGWETRTPLVDEAVTCIHHPGGTEQRVNHGHVNEVGVRVLGYRNQTEVVWDVSGVTEGGSSGSPLMFESTVQLFGMLSGGPQHSCGSNRSGNIDNYSSFRDFFPQIEAYVNSTNPPGGGGGGGGVNCPAKKAYGDLPELLGKLRAFRDNGLATSVLGQKVIDGYYTAAPTAADAVETSETARNAFKAISAPFATVGSWLD